MDAAAMSLEQRWSSMNSAFVQYGLLRAVPE